MKTKIKLLSVSVVAVTALFLGANFASAQTAIVASCSSVTLNATLSDTGGASTSVWFEWGTNYNNVDVGSGTKTSSQVFNSPQSFSQIVYGLNQSTTYYYRAVFSNVYGASYGGTLYFVTPPCAVQVNQNYSQPYVSTNSVSSVSQNSATLNGYVTPNGANGSAWFEWGTSYSLGNTTPYISYGTGSTSFNSSLFNLSANTTYYYRAAAQSSYGIVYGSTLSFTTTGQTSSQTYVTTNSASSVSQNSATLNGYVTGTNTSAWFEWGTSSSLGNTTPSVNYGTSGASYNSLISGLNTNTTYYYRAATQSSYGIVYGSTLSFTTTGQTYNYNYNYNTSVGSAPTVTTLLATEQTGATAKLNGLVVESSSQSSSAWFEWGTTSSLGNKTSTINVGNLPVVKHSDFITGLVSGQTYYYRIAAQNSYGTSYGGVNSFVSETSTYAVTPTVAVTVTKTPVVLKPTTTVITRGTGAQSPVSLSIEGGAEMIGSGEKRTYRVQWKNDNAGELKNVVLRVVFPASMNIDSATKGTFSATDNSVVVDLKALPSKESGDTFIFATTGRGLKSGEVLVVTANMVYTGSIGVQGDAVAYVMHRAEMTQKGGASGANIFGAGEFVPTTLFEWILLMILTLVLVLLGNHLYGRFSSEKH